ncbi:hypothetical protein THAOC_17537, partial [Thalassiosira oceanica]
MVSLALLGYNSASMKILEDRLAGLQWLKILEDRWPDSPLLHPLCEFCEAVHALSTSHKNISIIQTIMKFFTLVSVLAFALKSGAEVTSLRGNS